MNSKLCPKCQAEIPAHAPGNLCPSCVLRGADETQPANQSAPSVKEITKAFPQFEVLSFVGQGGMGSVYQIRQADLDRTAALKILSPALSDDPAFAERFAREARVMGKLQHPNIVTIYESGECGGYFYLLMEFVDGVNLRQAMQVGQFTPERALAVVPGLCDALQAAHAEGIWHRDIKPENILLDKEGRVKIVDFGIARLVGDPQRNFTLTMEGQALGSRAYMAPEQHEKPHEVDHRADIFSLGVVIYELLTGELPLGRFPSPGERSEVDARIDEIVLKTLEKERAHRQQSATEVKTDFETASVTKAKSPAKSESESIFNDPQKFFVTSLGLWLGGVGGALIGALTSPAILGLGCLAAFFGLIGCGWILLRIRKKRHPVKDRLPLLAFVFWPCACAAVLAVIQLWIVAIDISERISSEGEVWNPNLLAVMPLVFAVLAIIAPLLVAMLLWRIFAKGEREAAFKWWPVVASCFVVMVAMPIDHFGRERLALYRTTYASVSPIGEKSSWAEDRTLIEEAMAKVAVDLPVKARLFAPNDPELSKKYLAKDLEMGWIYIDWRSSSDEKAADVEDRYFRNLHALLPNRMTGRVASDLSASYQEILHYRTMKASGFIAAFGMVLLLTSRRWTGVAFVGGFSLLVGGVLILLDWPGVPEDAPSLIAEVDAVPIFPEREFDYSTTRDAITSHVKAAKKGDQAVFEVALSTRLIDLVSKSGGDISSVMEKWQDLSYGNRIGGDDEEVRVRLKGKSGSESFTAHLVMRDRNWQIDSLFPISMKQTPEDAAREMVKAAKAGDRLKFLNGYRLHEQDISLNEELFLQQLDQIASMTNYSVVEDGDETRLSYFLPDLPDMRWSQMMFKERGAWKFAMPPNPIESAVLPLLEVAKSGDERLFRKGMSKDLLEETNDVPSFMKEIGELLLIKAVGVNDSSVANIVMKKADESGEQREFLMIKEEGRWKLRGKKAE